jgi:hypothetical protein
MREHAVLIVLMRHDGERSGQPNRARLRVHWLAVACEITGGAIEEGMAIECNHNRRFDGSLTAHAPGDWN